MPASEENCAICASISLLSTGSNGSCCWIWTVSRRRKSAWPNVSKPRPAVAGRAAFAEAAPKTELTVISSSWFRASAAWRWKAPRPRCGTGARLRASRPSRRSHRPEPTRRRRSRRRAGDRGRGPWSASRRRDRRRPRAPSCARSPGRAARRRRGARRDRLRLRCPRRCRRLRGSRPPRTSAQAARTWRAGRRRRESSGRSSSFALQRPRDLLDAATEEIESRRILHGGFGERGLRGRHLDGVAVEARHHGHAVLQGRAGRGFGLRAAEPGLQRGGEVDVAGLVSRGRGIGDVRAQHAKALRPHFERRSVDAEKTFAHGRLHLLRRLFSKERANLPESIGPPPHLSATGKALPTDGKVPPHAETAEIAPFLGARRNRHDFVSAA